jgi:hypothetical protein
MATIKRVENQICQVEDFDVIFVTEDGRDVRGDRTGIPGYSNKFENRAPGRMTVEGWKERRFRTLYPGFEAEVLLADGTHARGNTLLDSVRASYEDRD